MDRSAADRWAPYLRERFGESRRLVGFAELKDRELQELANELEPHLQAVDAVIARWQKRVSG